MVCTVLSQKPRRGLEMSPVLHGLMLSRDQAMQGYSTGDSPKVKPQFFIPEAQFRLH